MNIVMLIGYVGRDPQLRSFPDGDRVAQTSLATSKPVRNQSTGELESRTEWHRIRFYGPASGGLVDRVAGYVRKGSRIAVVGEQTTSTIVTAQGERIPITYVDVRMNNGLELLDPPRNRGETEGARTPAATPAAPQETSAASPTSPATPSKPPAAATPPRSEPAAEQDDDPLAGLLDDDLPPPDGTFDDY